MKPKHPARTSMKHTRHAPQREIRTYTAARPMTVRTLQDGTKKVGGYAVVWGSPSSDLGGFTEICTPGMLTRTLRENTSILALRDHRSELLLGNTAAGTLELKPDATGLAFTITLPQTQIGDDTAENVRLGNLTGVSFGFSCRMDEWKTDANGSPVRYLLDVDLHEISPTSFAAYPAANVSTRSCPASLRSKLKTRDVDDMPECDPDSPDYGPENPDCQEDRSECQCSCAECEADNCGDCDNEDCEGDADDCIDCGMSPDANEDRARADSLRIRQLFAHRMK